MFANAQRMQLKCRKLGASYLILVENTMIVAKKLCLLSVAFLSVLPVMVAGGDVLAAPQVSTSIGTKIDDTVVTTKVKSALLDDPSVKSFDIKVETRKGVVQLSGFVDSQFQMDRAIDAALAVEGVSKVHNNINLKSGKATVGNAVDDSVITTQVKAALLANPNVKSMDIAVVTRKGRVQLSGFVNSQSQITQALAVAEQVVGVKTVSNEMSVKQ